MERITPQTPDITARNIDRLAELFPNVVTETRDANGDVKHAIDFDLLRQELSDHVVDGPRERYQLDWPGKRQALVVANSPISKTLRPDREESVDFDTTKNLFIEGDNLDALKLLQESYLGKVKLIYIDPPYNTGNDFIYRDDFAETTAEYLEKSGQTDDDGNRLVANTESNGRFHSDWLSMMYPRLKLARNLLRDDGVALISIGESEIANLQALAREVFGSDNVIGCLVWEKKKKGAFLSGSVTNVKDYVLVVARHRPSFPGMIGEVTTAVETYPVIKTTNTRGVRVIRAGIKSRYRASDHMVAAGTRLTSGNMEMVLLDDLVIRDHTLASDIRIDSNWIYSQELLDDFVSTGALYITQDLYFRRVVSDPRTKMLRDLLPMKGGSETGARYVRSDDLSTDGWGTNEDGFNELHDLLGAQGVMSFPKPSKLVAKLAFATCRDDREAIVLDFFAGSGTTGDAMMQLNAADGGRRRTILVQLREDCDPESAAARAGYVDIAQIARERLRRSGRKVVEESNRSQDAARDLDIGFRALRIDSSSLAATREVPNNQAQDELDLQIQSVKPDRGHEDLLFQVLLDWGLDLALPIERTSLADHEVLIVDNGPSGDGAALTACFDERISLEVVREIAKLAPRRAVFRHSGFASDSDRINTEQIFTELSPHTDVKTI